MGSKWRTTLLSSSAKTARCPAVAEVTPRAGRSCLDYDLEDAGRHAPHLQNRNPARACREESSAARRDALKDRLQGHRHHTFANACDPEGPPLTSSLHTGAHLRRHGTPRFGDARAALV